MKMNKILIAVIAATSISLVGCASDGSTVAQTSDKVEEKKKVATKSRKSCPKVTGSRMGNRC